METTVTYRQWPDGSWTARVTLPNNTVEAFSRKKRSDLDRFIRERFFSGVGVTKYPVIS